MKYPVLSAVAAALILFGANAAQATGGHENGGGGSGGVEKDGSPGPDNEGAAASSATEAALAECARLREDRQIAQSGPQSGAVIVPDEPLDCDMPRAGQTN